MKQCSELPHLPHLPVHTHPLSDQPRSLVSSNYGLIICIQTQTTPITAPVLHTVPHYRYLQSHLALVWGGLALCSYKRLGY